MDSNYKIHLGESLYILSFALFVVRLAIGNTTMSSFINIHGTFFTVILFVSIALLSIKFVIFDRFNLRIAILMVLVLLVLIKSFRSSGYNDMVVLVLLLLGSRGVRLESIVKCHFIVYFTVTLIAMALAVTGVIDNYAVNAGIRGFRFSLGNTYPTDFAAGTLYLILDYAYLKGKNWKLRNSALVVVISVLVFMITDANANFFLSLSLSILMLLFQYSPGKRVMLSRGFKWCVAIAIPVFSIVSIYVQNNYLKMNSVMLHVADILLNNRIAYGYKAIQQYGITPFGTQLNLIGSGWGTNTFANYLYVDNGYLQFALMYGWIPLTLFCLGLSFAIIHEDFGERNGIVSVVLLIMAISGIIEPRFLNVLYDPFIVLVGLSLFSSKNQILRLRENIVENTISKTV